MANTRKSRQTEHGFENKPPAQEKFPQEHAGVTIHSTARPMLDEGMIGLGEAGKNLEVPQRKKAYGEFMRFSETKGVRESEE